MNNKQTYAVIGGGLLGMTLAYRLAQKGYEVTLYEAAPTLGGLASTWEIDGVTWDKFYHVILLSDSHTRKIIGELNLDDQMQWVETKTGFYTGGKLYSMSNTVEFLKFPPLSLVDKFRLGGTIFYTSKLRNWRKLEGIPVEKFLRRLSGNNTFEKMWLPLLRSKLGEFYKRTSAAFIWATIQRMYSARKSGLKKEMFGYMKGGYATILNAFVMKLLEQGVTIKSNHQVSEISKNSDGKITVKFNNDTTADFDKVISTIPSSFIPPMVPSLSHIEKDKHTGIEYLGVICASVVLRKAISPYYVTNITDSGKPFTGIIEMTALVNPAELKGKHLVYLPKYVGSNDPIFAASDAEIIREFTEALRGMYPQLTDDDIVHVAVARARNVFALSTLNYSQSLPPVASSIDGLYLLNSAHITNGTLNVNETIQLAERFMEGM
jgi:protoporphyrinogen oxidase